MWLWWACTRKLAGPTLRGRGLMIVRLDLAEPRMDSAANQEYGPPRLLLANLSEDRLELVDRVDRLSIDFHEDIVWSQSAQRRPAAVLHFGDDDAADRRRQLLRDPVLIGQV